MVYTTDEVIRRLERLAAKLENSISPLPEGVCKGGSMPKRLGEKVTVDGRERWVHGYSVQELFDNYVDLLVREGLVERIENDEALPSFGSYLRTFYDIFKSGQESNTVVNRERIIKNHILPQFGEKRIDRIRTTDIQKWFNSLAKKYSKETILKIKNIMNPVFEAAVEDELLTRNPMASSRLVIGGKESVHHKALPKEKMEEIRDGIPFLPEKEKLLAALLCYTGMRFEEILGLRWEDIYDDRIMIQRAVTHPKRNMPEIKCPKTKTSARIVPLHPELQKLLKGRSAGFILPSAKDDRGETPMSYTEARRLFDKLRKRFDILDYTAHDFRDTCATEWREKGIALDVIARMLGHSKTETTEKRYVKYREDMMEKAREMM